MEPELGFAAPLSNFFPMYKKDPDFVLVYIMTVSHMATYRARTSRLVRTSMQWESELRSEPGVVGFVSSPNILKSV
jgi:hypothetical protein